MTAAQQVRAQYTPACKLEAGCALRAGHAARYAWLDPMKHRYPVSIACEVLEVGTSARMHKALRARGVRVGKDRVQRRFKPEEPNQLWSGAMTYMTTDECWLYLAAVLDLFSRQVVGWSLQEHMHTGPGQGRAGHGVVAASPAAWQEIPQRPWQPVLQP